MIGYGVRGRERQRKLRIVSAFVFYCHESQKGKTIFPHRLRSRREIVLFVISSLEVLVNRALCYIVNGEAENLFSSNFACTKQQSGNMPHYHSAKDSEKHAGEGVKSERHSTTK